MIVRLVACVCFLLLLTSTLMLPSPAHAQDSAADAARLKAEGDALMGEIKYAEALQRYEEAYKRSADPALLYNQGRALEALGRYPEALDKLRAFDAKAPPELHARVPNLKKLIDEVDARTTLLTVEVTQPGATIRIGSQIIGTSPLPETRVNAAKSARIEVSLEGFDPERRDMELPGGKKVKLAVNLFPKDKTGVLIVDSPVKGASISVDGSPKGQVPTEVRVPPGTHQVTLTAPGYEDNTIEVVLNPAERKQITIEPGTAPIYEQWWFWTIGGTLLVGGGAAALTYALLTEGDPDQGTIAPCQVKVSATGADCVAPESVGPRAHGRGADVVGHRQTAPGGFTFGPVPVVTVRF